jgi:hypothetical protein
MPRPAPPQGPARERLPTRCASCGAALPRPGAQCAYCRTYPDAYDRTGEIRTPEKEFDPKHTFNPGTM